MKLPFCLLFVGLLASCDKPGDTGKSGSAAESNPGITRAARQPRMDVLNRRKDLRDSLTAALALEASEARDQALAQVVRDAFELAPEIAAEAFGQLAVDSAERMKTIRCLAELHARKNPDEALAWADSLGSATEITAAKNEIALVFAETYPSRAAKILLETGISSGEPAETKVEVIRHWAGIAPKDAVTWALSLPPGDARSVGIETVVSQWLQADSTAAFAWLAALTNQSAINEVTRAMAQALVALPGFIRETLIVDTDPAIRSELQQQVDQIIDTGKAKDEIPLTPSERAPDQ